MAIIGLALTSCEMFDTETKYYVKYEVEAVEGTDISEYHQILVVTAWEKAKRRSFSVKIIGARSSDHFILERIPT